MADVLETIAQSASIDVYGEYGNWKNPRETNIAEGELNRVSTLYKVAS